MQRYARFDTMSVAELQKDADAQVRQSTIRMLGTQPKGAETLTAIAAQGKAIGDIKAAIDGLGGSDHGALRPRHVVWVLRVRHRGGRVGRRSRRERPSGGPDPGGDGPRSERGECEPLPD